MRRPRWRTIRRLKTVDRESTREKKLSKERNIKLSAVEYACIAERANRTIWIGDNGTEAKSMSIFYFGWTATAWAAHTNKINFCATAIFFYFSSRLFLRLSNNIMFSFISLLIRLRHTNWAMRQWKESHSNSSPRCRWDEWLDVCRWREWMQRQTDAKIASACGWPQSAEPLLSFRFHSVSMEIVY